MYLSVAYFGRSAYGITSASQIYFGKNPIELKLREYPAHRHAQGA
jgi:membrane peptidoglycan carboxypeptidase